MFMRQKKLEVTNKINLVLVYQINENFYTPLNRLMVLNTARVI